MLVDILKQSPEVVLIKYLSRVVFLGHELASIM